MAAMALTSWRMECATRRWDPTSPVDQRTEVVVVPTLGLDESLYIYAEHPECCSRLLRTQSAPSVDRALKMRRVASEVIADSKTVAAAKQALQTT